ncbi:MAG: RNA polymerase sigma factor [Sandaracinaceae bacterium]|jgi:RNA polymerase sigma-70 factor (ECF subfamily)|nr:RNA polymerase sigma factor [Sandaracinaceae bacterium]MBK7152772.1 RNA polymerase sigma factor [Sandaracinaceae bacterium]MBK7773999.1 RNA polymerase sigma factor [Sandaracinaceae bacterium]MBK8412179.1 RNA polymerase sigma factor [Sandaracinaceae bacterium]MBK8587981.1 RNA polymerase sigma factor [Sandaracinaceae bacterium]
MTETSAQSFEGHLERGDLHAAADWLVRAHGRDVLHLCTTIVRDRGTAEDLAQDAFGKAFLALPEFRGEASARTWLLTIARHRCLDHLRRSARQPWSLGREDDVREPLVADTEEVLVSDLMARRADIREGLAVLSEGERAMVLLRFAHGLSFDEIAESFGVKSGAVRMRVGRALTKMRDAIEGPALGVGAAAPAYSGALPSFGAPAAPGAPLAQPAPMPPPPRAAAPESAQVAPPAAYAPPAPAPAPSARPTGAPSGPVAPPLSAGAPARGAGVWVGLTRLFDGLRGVPSASPPAPSREASASAAPQQDASATLGALLLAADSDPSADAAFLARLTLQLRSPA